MSNRRKTAARRIAQMQKSSQMTPAQRAGEEPYTKKQHKRRLRADKLMANLKERQMDALYANMSKENNG